MYSKFYKKGDYTKKKKKQKRYHMKPMAMDKLITGALGRHNIAKQVTAAMIVSETNKFLEDLLEHHVWMDVRALSYANHELKIACKNPSASFVMQDHIEAIENNLKRSFPDTAIEKILCILNQDPWLHRSDAN